MQGKNRQSREKNVWILIMAILLLLLFLAFYRYLKLSGSWMKSVEDTQKLQESYSEILQENQEKIRELEKQIEQKTNEE